MMKRMRLLTIVLALASVYLGTSSTWGQACQDSRRIGDRIIVRIAAVSSLEAFIADFTGRHPAIGIQVLDQVPGRPLFLLKMQLPPGTTVTELDALEIEIDTTYASLDWGEMLYENESPEGTTGSTLVNRVAPSTDYKNQYTMEKLGLTIFPDPEGGGTSVYQRSTGRGVVVAVLDTGIDPDHVELVNKIAPGGFDFVDGDADVRDLPDGLDNDEDGLIDEMTGHGTFVAGLVTLIAPDVRILPIRVLNSDGRGDLWWLARGVFHAIDQGSEIINISIGSTYNSKAVENAIDVAELLGIPVIAAAGNCNQNQTVFRAYPAMVHGVIGVTAVDGNDVKGSFSNFGNKIFISAPGVNDLIDGQPDPNRSIISLLPGDQYGYWEGTSMAAPIVSGVAALVRSQHPEWAYNEPTLDLFNLILSTTSDPLDAINPGHVGLLGSGRVNALSAVNVGPIAPKKGDLDANGNVGVFDLIKLLSDWGRTHTSADFNGDGTVNVVDLLVILGNWG